MFALVGEAVPSLMLINSLYNLLNTERCLRRNKCATNISECMMSKHYSAFLALIIIFLKLLWELVTKMRDR